MGMTIDEIIAKETEIAQEFQKVIDTHIVGDNSSLEELFCDDTEVIEEHLQRCKVFADYHNQIAVIMRKYQKIQEIVSSKTTRLSYEDGFRQIKEVVKNGNDD